MKSLFAFLLFPILCVQCFPWDDCGDDDDLACNELSPVLPQLAEAVPYQDGEELAFQYEDEQNPVRFPVFRNVIPPAVSLNCQDELEVVLRVTSADRVFNLAIVTDPSERPILQFGFSFGQTAAENSAQFDLTIEADETLSVPTPLTLRTIPDTIMRGVAYREVLVVEKPAAELGQISAFYYNQTDGLLRVEWRERPAFFRVE